jgi:ribosomal protein L19
MISELKQGRRIFMNIIDKINEKQIRKDIPEFRVGDTVRVDYKIIEGKRERIQAFEGIVVAKRNGSVSETFTVRKISSGVGVERIFPVNSPKIDKITVVRKGKVRRAKLTFLKNRVGQYKIKERGQKVSKSEEK